MTLQGFQTAKYEHVVVEASRSTDLRVKLGVGATTETVTVRRGPRARDVAERDLDHAGSQADHGVRR